MFNRYPLLYYSMTETYNKKVDSSIITELIIGQMDKWYLNILALSYDDSSSEIVVKSLDSGHILQRIDVPYDLHSRDSSFDEVDTEYIAAKVNYEHKKEMERM